MGAHTINSEKKPQRKNIVECKESNVELRQIYKCISIQAPAVPASISNLL
jgi:hypothetical protein